MAALDDITFRPMTPADIADGLRLCRASRWNQVERDWAQFLALDPAGAVLACRGDRVVGSVATVRYAPDLAWVAMVLVMPEERGRGIGRALLQQGLALVEAVPVVGLDATPAGRPLYLTLGFEDADALRRLQRDGGGVVSGDAVAADDGAQVRPLAPDDWPTVLQRDRRVTGVDRTRMLRWLAEGAPSWAWVSVSATGQVDGAVFGRQGHTFAHLGPVVAEDEAAARRVMAAALGEVPPDRPVVIDAAGADTGWPSWLEAIGFVEQRPFTRMYRGGGGRRGGAPGVFAIIGPEFG